MTTAIAAAIDHDRLADFIERKWNNEILHALTDYIAVPAKSPAFDPDWRSTATSSASSSTPRSGPSGSR